MKIAIVLLLLVALAFADSCGGNCPSGRCPTCYCGTTKSVLDIAAWCAKYSWNQNCCKCIVSHESGGNANALNYNSNASTDVGLWQINTVNIELFRSTGDSAAEDMPLAIPLKTSTAPSRSMDGEETLGNFGAPTLPVDVDQFIT
jgi:hypothetical protein